MKHFRIMIATAAMMMSAVACTTSPQATYVNFGSASYSFSEAYGEAQIYLYEYYTPYSFPVKVNVRVSVESGNVPLGEMIAFDEPDFTVTADGDDLLLSGIEITIDNNASIPFTIIDNDYLNDQLYEIRFEMMDPIEGSEIGTISYTIVTIVDNEYAPRIKAGYYKALYTPLAAAERTDAGEFIFYMTKTGKYEYTIESLFGIDDNYPPRPRLTGTFDPAAKTLVFDGADYDEVQKAAEDSSYTAKNAFGTTYFFYNQALDKVLVFEGAGASGQEPIVFTTEAIDENSSGLILAATAGCSFGIYDYTLPVDGEITEGTRGSKTGVWDGFTTADFTYIGSTLPTSNAPTRATSPRFVPFK